MARKARLFFEVAYSRCKSMRTAMMALEFLVEYGRACDKQDRALTIEEYGDHVGLSRSQAFRRQAAFRRCFPADDVANTWAIVKPLVDKYGGEAKSTQMQAVIVGTLTWKGSES